jgi:hypothetical protein
MAGTYVSCATGQESVSDLCMSLGSLLFDPCLTLFHIYHSPSITDVVCIHHDGLPPIYFPLWDALVYALPPMYYYIRDPLLAL